jgi:putative transposase
MRRRLGHTFFLVFVRNSGAALLVIPKVARINPVGSRRDLPMKKSRYTEEQIAFALRQAEMGTPVAEVVRNGRQRTDLLRWKKQYGGTGVGEIRRLKQLEEGNRKLKHLVGRQLRCR